MRWRSRPACCTIYACRHLSFDQILVVQLASWMLPWHLHTPRLIRQVYHGRRVWSTDRSIWGDCWDLHYVTLNTNRQQYAGTLDASPIQNSTSNSDTIPLTSTVRSTLWSVNRSSAGNVSESHPPWLSRKNEQWPWCLVCPCVATSASINTVHSIFFTLWLPLEFFFHWKSWKLY